MFICCKRYFVFVTFVVYVNHESVFTMKISISKVSQSANLFYTPFLIVICLNLVGMHQET